MPSNCITFKADKETISKLMDFYSFCKVEINNDLLLFKAKGDKYTLQIYQSGTVMFQGNEAEKEAKIWTSISSKEDFYSKVEDVDFLDHMGSDEVGCGDYFGPVVVSAVYIQKKQYDEILHLGVKDSKQLNDKKILEIAPQLLKKVKSCTFVLSNQKYNEIHDNYNLNKVKAYLHNFVLYTLGTQENFYGKTVVDQFCEGNLFYRYLNDYKSKNIRKDIYFTTKAENKYLAVACASIIARYTFLLEMDKLSQRIGKKIPLGANKAVDQFAYELALKIGFEKMNSFVKIHFKDTDVVKDKLNIL